MSKQQNLEQFGVVLQELGNSMFKVSLDATGHEIICTISGKIRKNYIRIMAGDKVKLEMSPYDLNRGRITTRINVQQQTESADSTTKAKKNNGGGKKKK